jgi:hypothetical protein
MHPVEGGVFLTIPSFRGQSQREIDANFAGYELERQRLPSPIETPMVHGAGTDIGGIE